MSSMSVPDGTAFHKNDKQNNVETGSRRIFRAGRRVNKVFVKARQGGYFHGRQNSAPLI